MLDEKSEKIDKLVVLVKKGDVEAFSALYDELVDSVYRYIYFKVNGDDVEDLLEIVFMKVWENIHQYEKQKTSFSSWVFRIAHNLIVDHYRLKKDTVELSPVIPTYERVHNPIRVAEDNLNKETLRKGIKKLKPGYQQIVILKFINELSNAEVARILGKTEGSLRVLQFRALKELKEILKEMGLHY